MQHKTIIIAIAFVLICDAFAAEVHNNNTVVLTIPGQNGLGSECIIGSEGFQSWLPEYKYRISLVEVPEIRIDFGQQHCINELNKRMVDKSKSTPKKSIILHAVSQGTATAINFFNKKRELFLKSTILASSFVGVSEQSNQVKALILESVMLSGNSAICHTVAQSIGFALPFAYYWQPFLAKLVFPFYNISGDQACSSCDLLPRDIPIIIVHNHQDFQLSYQDAKGLYAYLKSRGYQHVYFIPHTIGKKHFYLIQHETFSNGSNPLYDYMRATRAILWRYGLLKEDLLNGQLDEVNPSEYQPAINHEDLKHFYDIRKKETRLGYLNWLVSISVYCGLFYFLYKNSGLFLKMFNQS